MAVINWNWFVSSMSLFVGFFFVYALAAFSLRETVLDVVFLNVSFLSVWRPLILFYQTHEGTALAMDRCVRPIGCVRRLLSMSWCLFERSQLPRLVCNAALSCFFLMLSLDELLLPLFLQLLCDVPPLPLLCPPACEDLWPWLLFVLSFDLVGRYRLTAVVVSHDGQPLSRKYSVQ